MCDEFNPVNWLKRILSLAHMSDYSIDQASEIWVKSIISPAHMSEYSIDQASEIWVNMYLIGN